MSSKDGGVGILKRLGINKGFTDEMYRKYGKYADRIPGFSKSQLDNLYNSYGNIIPDEKNNSTQQSRQAQNKWDKNKYPKI